MGFAASVGKYHLGRTIGEGNFAKVKLGFNMDTNDRVAIKIIDKKMVLDNKLMDQVYIYIYLCYFFIYFILFIFNLIFFFSCFSC